MHKMPSCRALALALLGLGGCVAASAQPYPAATDPTDPKADARPLLYRPALQRYQPLQEQQPLRDWRAANQRVHEAGGWRSYLREAQVGAPASAPAQIKTPPAASPAHQH